MSATIPIVICKKVIFKQINENISRVIRTHTRGPHQYPPLSPDEIQNPPGYFDKGYGEWEKRLRNTPISSTEMASPQPKGATARDIWNERRDVTPPDPTSESEPGYGTKERQQWRERAQDGDNYGHHWVEIYNSDIEYSQNTLDASYGWWPASQLSTLYETVKGVPGCLNAGDGVNGHDPHSFDWLIDDAFHPVVKGHTEDAVIAEIHSFAASYDDTPRQWAYPAGPSDSRSNCQKFQRQLRSELRKKCGRVSKHPIDMSLVVL